MSACAGRCPSACLWGEGDGGDCTCAPTTGVSFAAGAECTQEEKQRVARELNAARQQLLGRAREVMRGPPQAAALGTQGGVGRGRSPPPDTGRGGARQGEGEQQPPLSQLASTVQDSVQQQQQQVQEGAWHDALGARGGPALVEGLVREFEQLCQEGGD